MLSQCHGIVFKISENYVHEYNVFFQKFNLGSIKRIMIPLGGPRDYVRKYEYVYSPKSGGTRGPVSTFNEALEGLLARSIRPELYEGSDGGASSPEKLSGTGVPDG